MDTFNSLPSNPIIASTNSNNSTSQVVARTTPKVTHSGNFFGRKLTKLKLTFDSKEESELIHNCISSARKLLEQEKVEISDRKQAIKYYQQVLRLTNSLEVADYERYACCLKILEKASKLKGALECLEAFYQTYRTTKVSLVNNEAGLLRSFNLNAVATLDKYEPSRYCCFLQLRDGNLLTGPAFGGIFKSFEVWELNTHKIIRKYTGHGDRVRPWTQLKNGWIVYGERESMYLHGWQDDDLENCDLPNRVCLAPTRNNIVPPRHLLPASQTIKPVADDLLAVKTLGLSLIVIEKIPWGRDTIATLKANGLLSDFCNLEVVDNDLLALAGYSKIHLWETKNYSEVDSLTSGCINDIHVLSALNNGLLASASNIFEWKGSSRTVKTGVIQLWEPRMMKCLATTEGHTGRIRGLTHLSNGLLASTSEGNTLKLWDVKSPTLECVATFDVPEQGNLIQLSNGLIPILENCRVRLYDLTETSALF